MTSDERQTCEQTIRELDLEVDGEVSPARHSRAARHRAECAECAREYRFERRLWSEIRRALRATTAPPQLRERIRVSLALAADGT